MNTPELLPIVGEASACDTCRDPGHCCHGFRLNRTFPVDMHRDEIRAHVRAGTDSFGGSQTFEPAPFEPANRGGEFWAWPGDTKPIGVTWSFDCPKLGDDGRCTIYETRPALCRRYEPKTDGLCIEFVPEPEDLKFWEVEGK